MAAISKIFQNARYPEDTLVKALSTVAAMQADTFLAIGDSVKTDGYTTAGDGGGATYLVAASQAVDGYGDHALANGTVALLQKDDGITFLCYGVSEILSDNSPAATAALAANTGSLITLPAGDYEVERPIEMPTVGCSIRGTGRLFAVTLAGVPVKGQRILSCEGCSGFSITGVTFDTSTLATFTNGGRAIYLDQCTSFSIVGVKFKVSGAAYGATACSKYLISQNVASVVSTDNLPKHDGIYDQWAGSSNFTITDNYVTGNGIGKYGILVTGETTANTAAGCEDFVIANNRCKGLTQSGIWSSGRSGINKQFTITGNTVTDITPFHGINVSDASSFTVSANTIRNIGANGIRLHEETTSNGVTGARIGSVTGNSIYNCNTVGSAGATEGSTIAVLASSSSAVNVTGNTIEGTNHIYGVLFGGGVTGCSESGNKSVGHTGTTAVLDSSGTRTNLISSGVYTITGTAVTNTDSLTGSLRYRCNGDSVTCFLKFTLDPTAAGDTIAKFDLPVAASLVTAGDLYGAGNDSFSTTANLYADTVNNEGVVRMNAGSASAVVLYGSFTYAIDN